MGDSQLGKPGPVESFHGRTCLKEMVHVDGKITCPRHVRTSVFEFI